MDPFFFTIILFTTWTIVFAATRKKSSTRSRSHDVKPIHESLKLRYREDVSGNYHVENAYRVIESGECRAFVSHKKHESISQHVYAKDIEELEQKVLETYDKLKEEYKFYKRFGLL